MSVVEVASHLICSQCGSKNTELKAPIWARTDTRVSDAPSAMPSLPATVTDNVCWSVPRIERDALLKACSLAFPILITVIAVAPFVGAKKLVVDPIGRQGLIMALECAITPDGKRLPCLKLYSQQTGVLFGSSKMGKLTIVR
jgi:hypothetical protein